jgi:hypothetical protein
MLKLRGPGQLPTLPPASSFECRRSIKNPSICNVLCYETFTWPRNFTVSSKRRLKKITTGTLNVDSLYKIGTWESLATEITKYNLDTAGIVGGGGSVIKT